MDRLSLSELDGRVAAVSSVLAGLIGLLWVLLRKTRSVQKTIPHSCPSLLPFWDFVLIIFKYGGDGQRYFRDRRDALKSDAFYVRLSPDLGKVLVLCHPVDHTNVYAKEGKLGMEVLLPDSVHKLHGDNNMQHMPFGSKHQFQRKIFSSIVSPRALGAIVPTVLQSFESMWERLDSSQSHVSIQEEIQTTKLRLMAQILYGFSFKTSTEEEEFQQLASDFDLQHKALFQSERSSAFKEGLAAAKRNDELLKKVFKGMLKKHRQAKESSETVDSNSAMETIAESLVKENLDTDKNSLDLIEDNLSLLLEASHSTSLFVTTGLLYLLNLPENAHILEKVRTEVRAVNEPVTFETFNKEFPYLEGCIKESMRIVTLIGASQKLVTTDEKIMLKNGYQLRGPCTVMFQYSMHYSDPTVFPSPDKMIPERWMAGGNEHQASEFARKVFKPFSAGRHRCIGEKMAMLNIKCAVYSFARNEGRRLDFNTTEIGIEGGLFPEKKIKNGFPARVVLDK